MKRPVIKNCQKHGQKSHFSPQAPAKKSHGVAKHQQKHPRVNVLRYLHNYLISGSLKHRTDILKP
jgi:hypothetical protein